MMKKAAAVVVVIVATAFLVACSRTHSPASPSTATDVSASPDAINRDASSSLTPASLGKGQQRMGLGFNGTVSGFPTGVVFLTGGGSYDRTTGSVVANGGFRCLDSVLQGPLSTSINPKDPGPCLKDQGVRWDTDALLASTVFKCDPAATDRTAVTSDRTLVLQADFYRAGDGNNESFTAKMIVTDGDLAPDLPGLNLWIQGVGCGTARAVNFSRGQ